MPKEQSELFDRSFETASAPNPVFCHQEFLEKLEANRSQAVGKRAALLMQRLAIDERRQHFKGTRGVNQGWRRSRLGGNQGSHFYAWWAPRTAAPFQRGEGFQEAPEGALFLRDIRHHDDHSELHPQSFHAPLPAHFRRRCAARQYGPAPWTIPQFRFASARRPCASSKVIPVPVKPPRCYTPPTIRSARVLYITYSLRPGFAGARPLPPILFQRTVHSTSSPSSVSSVS